LRHERPPEREKNSKRTAKEQQKKQRGKARNSKKQQKNSKKIQPGNSEARDGTGVVPRTVRIAFQRAGGLLIMLF
jgi:hypothetical protein